MPPVYPSPLSSWHRTPASAHAPPRPERLSRASPSPQARADVGRDLPSGAGPGIGPEFMEHLEADPATGWADRPGRYLVEGVGHVGRTRPPRAGPGTPSDRPSAGTSAGLGPGISSRPGPREAPPGRTRSSRAVWGS